MIRDDEIIDLYPRFIAIKFQQLLECQEPGLQTCQAALNVLDRCLRLIAIYCTSQYLRRDRESFRNSELNKILDPKIKKGDLETVRSIVVATFKAYEGHQGKFFVPEMYHLYWDTSNSQKHTIKQGLWEDIKKIIPYANNLRDRINLPRSEEEWKRLTDDCVGTTRRFLKELSFLRDYEVLWISERARSLYTAQVHKGPNIKQVQFEYEGVLRPGWIYISKDRKSFLRLDPLIQKTSAEATAIYRELTSYAKLQYLLLTSEDPVEEDDDNLVEEFFNLLATIENVKRVTPTEDQLGWDDLYSIVEEHNRVSTGTLRGLDHNLYLQRDKLLSFFTDFLQQDPSCFVLTGRSGTGKSSFARSILDEIQDDQAVCPIFISAPSLNQKLDLDQAITEALYKSGNRSYIPGKKSIWDLIHHIADVGDEKMVLLILDAVNEHSQPSRLFEQIFSLLNNRYPWMKVLVTSRPETLELLGKSSNLSSINPGFFYKAAVDENSESSLNLPLAACEVLPFNANELKSVYRKYQAHYKLQTNIEEIEKNLPGVLALIKDPFYLSILAKKNQGKAISEQINQFTLIQKFIEELRQSDIKVDRAFMRIDIDFLKTELVPLFFPEKDSLVSQPLIDPLFDTSKYRDRLNDESVYSSKEFRNPILRLSQINIIRRSEDGTGTRVTFQHDKFLEFFLGEHLFTKLPEWYKHDITQGYRELISSALMDTPSFLGILQNSLYKHLQAGVENQGKIQVDLKSLCINTHPSVKLVVVPVLVAFHTEGFKSQKLVEQIVTTLAQIPITRETRRDREMLNAVLSARETALETAYHLRDLDVIVEALLDRNSEVRELGIRYTYLLDRDESQLMSEAPKIKPDHSTLKSIEILRRMSEQLSDRFIRNRHCFGSFAQLSVVLMIEHMDEEFEEGHPSPLINIVLGTVKKIGHFGDKKKTLIDQALQFVLMTLVLNFITGMLKFWVKFRRKRTAEWERFKQEESEQQQNHPATSVGSSNLFARLFSKRDQKQEVGNTSANYREFASYYRLPQEKRETAKRLSHYMDLEYIKKDYAAAEEVLLQGFLDPNCMTTTFGNAIASAWCTLEPDRVADLCEKIYLSDKGHQENGHWEVALDAAIIWYQSIKRQKLNDEHREQWDAWLKTGEDLIRKIIDEGGKRLGYGRFETDMGTYEQYPLLFHMALYNRIYPGSPNKLLDEYLERARNLSSKDREKLLIYLADTLGDRRAYLVNYPPVLRSFEEYIPKEKKNHSYTPVSDEFVAHLAASFAGIRGVYPHQIDQFLISVGAQKAFTDQVVQMSYERQSTVISLRAADFVYDLLIHGNQNMREILVQITHYMTHKRSFEEALREIGFFVVKKLNQTG